MAIAKSVTVPYLINAWQRVMLEQMPAFNQVAGVGAPLNRNCEVYVQPDRETIARALNNALGKISRLTRYSPYPEWYQDTLHFGSGLPTRLEYLQVNSAENGGSWRLLEFGRRATTLIEADATVVYTDSGYGVNDTATITVATTLANPDEIQIFFRVTDGAPGAADRRYQITPAQVTISGGQAIITAPRWLFVNPKTIWDVPYETTSGNYLEPNAANSANNSTDFVVGVDVYRVYTDTSTQLEVLDTNNAVLDTFTGVIVDAETGLFTFTQECAAAWACFCRHPVRLRVNYKAGLPLVNGYMDSELEDAIVRLANVIMPVELCAMCAATKNAWEQDRNPAVRDRVSLLSPSAANGAWGLLSFGAIQAWDVATDRAIVSGGKMTRRIR